MLNDDLLTIRICLKLGDHPKILRWRSKSHELAGDVLNDAPVRSSHSSHCRGLYVYMELALLMAWASFFGGLW